MTDPSTTDGFLLLWSQAKSSEETGPFYPSPHLATDGQSLLSWTADEEAMRAAIRTKDFIFNIIFII